ncbi:MAG: ABC transporter ATP-binding protein [Deltaproteobacteria bacterium]|nr:ABC transporter ATP-binding protein [Deltaproteobacteria bacterium]
MSLSLEGITKKVGRETHIDNVSLSFESGSRNILLGRTLAGKTSLLRLMAGLDRPTSGRVIENGVNVTGKSVRKRNIAMVYQQFINYPSLNIYKNIASPLKIAKVPKTEIDQRVRSTAEMLRIDNLLNRYPSELSGGQQQRVAIARALVKETDLLLLDEPLVNLDYKLREELREELQEIFETRQAIVVYTTTEPTEALMLGGNVVVMDEGRILQSGPTAEVYHRPATTRVAEVFSDPPINFLAGTIKQAAVNLGQDIEMPFVNHMESLSEGSHIFGVRSNHLFLSRKSEADVEIPAKVELSEINGSETFIHANHGEFQLVVQEKGIRTARIGADITIYVNPSRFFVYDEDGILVASPSPEALRAPLS